MRILIFGRTIKASVMNDGLKAQCSMKSNYLLFSANVGSVEYML
jgi:hypothetical protein